MYRCAIRQDRWTAPRRISNVHDALPYYGARVGTPL